MTVLYKNNASSSLAVAAGTGAGTLTLAAGEGARFPVLGGGDVFDITVEDLVAGTREIMLCTARAGDVLTVTRAQEGTVATAFGLGAVVENRLTAGRIAAFQIQNTNIALPAGATINWNAGDVILTHSANALAWSGAANGYSFDAVVKPSANDAAALGSATVSWADLFLASGGVLNFNNGQWVATHSGVDLSINAGTNGGLLLTDGTVAHRISKLSGSQVFIGTTSNHQINLIANNSVTVAITSTLCTIQTLLSIPVGQIAFPGTQNPSAGANTFDDYEEGTWTPALSATSGTITTMGTQTGWYRKVAGLLVGSADMTITTNGTGASTMNVNGLPFTTTATSSTSGREQGVSGKAVAGNVGSGGTAITGLTFYDNTYAGANSARIVLNFAYPCA